MPTPVAQTDPNEALQNEAAQVESMALGALNADLGRKWFEVQLGNVFAPSAALQQAIDAADKNLIIFGRAIYALQNGTAELVRWRLQSEPATTYRWAVHKNGAVLGIWPVVAIVVVVVAGLTAAAYWLSDTVGAAQKIAAQATLLKQQTLAEAQARSAAMRASGDATHAAALDTAIAKALGNDQPPPSFLDDLLSAVKPGAGAAGLGWGAAAALFLIFTMGKKR